VPDLRFEVTSVDSVAGGLTPSLQFKLRITNAIADESVQAILLNTQIQIQPAQRKYSAAERQRLSELFGAPEFWNQTLRNRFWANANATVSAFTGCTEAILAVPCTYDLNIAATKYFYALEGGEVSLLFLFSGSVFYADGNHLRVAPVSWNHECVFRMSGEVWRELMERQYANTAWVMLQRGVFDQLCEFKRGRAFSSWEETIENLLKNHHEPIQDRNVEGRAERTQRAEAST